MPCAAIGSVRAVATVRRGLRDEAGSWKTNCRRRRMGRMSRRPKPVRSRPSKRTRPPVGSTRRSTARPSVVFPQPDSPTSVRICPRWMHRSTPSTARTCPTVRLSTPWRIGKCTSSPSSRISASEIAVPGSTDVSPALPGTPVFPTGPARGVSLAAGVGGVSGSLVCAAPWCRDVLARFSGTAARSWRVYACAGRSSTFSRVPVSTMRPSRMTATRSAI